MDVTRLEHRARNRHFKRQRRHTGGRRVGQQQRHICPAARAAGSQGLRDGMAAAAGQRRANCERKYPTKSQFARFAHAVTLAYCSANKRPAFAAVEQRVLPGRKDGVTTTRQEGKGAAAAGHPHRRRRPVSFLHDSDCYVTAIAPGRRRATASACRYPDAHCASPKPPASCPRRSPRSM